MKSKSDAPTFKPAVTFARRWRRHLRNFGLTALRGAAYGSGMSVVTFTVWWFEHR